MNKIRLTGVVVAIAAFAAMLAFAICEGDGRPAWAAAPAGGSTMPASTRAADGQEGEAPAEPGPAPNVSLEIDEESDLAVFQGTPLILTVRIGNQRAANALAMNAGRARAAAEVKSPTTEQAAAREALLGEVEAVPTVTLPADWTGRVVMGTRRAKADMPDLEVNRALTPVTPASTQPAVLDGATVVEATWAISPEAAAKLPAGTWEVVAILDTDDGPQSAWRGKVLSEPVSLTIKPRPASLAGADAEEDALRIARYRAALGQWDQALPLARKATQFNPDSYAGYIVLGDSLAATGDKRAAIQAFATAMRIYRKRHPSAEAAPEYLNRRLRQVISAATNPTSRP